MLDAEQKLVADARQAGFALAKAGEREVIVDHETQLMDVTLRLEPGRRAEFGEVTFSGGDGVDFGFLRGRVPFAAGERYNPTLVEDSQKDLFDTNLFSTIVIRPADALTAQGRLDIAYDLRQRPPRSIGAELNYDTDIGPGGRVFWEHRNIFGAGERFRAEIAASELQQSLTTSLTKPDFLRVRQNLLVEATAERERLEAYDSDFVGTGVSVERELSKQLKVSLGTAFRYAQITDLNEPEQTFGLLSFPGKVDWDFANDRFSPTGGGTLLVTAAPYTNLIGDTLNFVKGRVTHTRYIQILPERLLTLALRGSVGRAERRLTRMRFRLMSASTPAVAARSVGSASSWPGRWTTTTSRWVADRSSKAASSCARAGATISGPRCSWMPERSTKACSPAARSGCCLVPARVCAISPRSARRESTSASHLIAARVSTHPGNSTSAWASPSDGWTDERI